jgi:chromosome segregation ATPase
VLLYSISNFKFELYEKDLELENLSKDNEANKKQLDAAIKMLGKYESEMKALWKQRDELSKENSDYQLEVQHLGEELRLVTKYSRFYFTNCFRYKDSLEEIEKKHKKTIEELRMEIKQKDDKLEMQAKELA